MTERQLPGNISPKDWYLSNFTSFENNLNGQSRSTIHSIRRSAIARFAELGFPTKDDEEWRFTDITPITKIRFELPQDHDVIGVTHHDLKPYILGDLKCHRMVFVNGRYSKQLSSVHALPAGVKTGGLAEFITSDAEFVERYLGRYAAFNANGFTALNTAFVYDGAFIHVPKSIVMDTPIQIYFVSTEHPGEFILHPRNLIVVDSNAEVSIDENYIGLGQNIYFTNSVSEIVLGENAVIEHDRIQKDGMDAFHVAALHVHQDRSSNYVSNTFTLGGRIVRNNINVLLDGEGAECTLNGLYICGGQQLVDNHTTIDHAKAHCPSHELYKGILAGISKGVFNGKIIVRPDAQKTDAKQTNKNLLLSDSASVDTKPQLEIYANDVKCTHGATIGQLDEESIFYLRSRGIDESSAREILLYAFAAEIGDRVSIKTLRDQLEPILHQYIQQIKLA